MKYLLDFRIFEAKNQEILKILKNNTGYYNLFNSFLEEGISIDILSELMERIRRDRVLIKTDLNTFSSLVTKYGVAKVARANQVAELYREQQKDGKVPAGTEFLV